jgi:phosphomevalonate kinase
LSGEYAVLGGAPAISTAVDRHAVVQIAETEDKYHRVGTPGHAEGSWRFTTDNEGQIDWLDEPPAQGLGLIEAGWRAVLPATQRRLSITVDTTEFFASGVTEKLGLGSSAAAMTALVGALDRLESTSSDIYTVARNAHKALQQGLGSGVDVATSFFGGVVEFRAGSGDVPSQCSWPDGLDFRFLWSGTAVSTMDKISGLEISAADDVSWGPLFSAAESAAVAWAEGDASRVLGACRRYTDALRQFGIDHDLGIFDAGHDELADLAESVDLVYKPCGAGGGDIGIVLASEHGDNGRELNRFCERAEAGGFQLLSLLPDPTGLSFASGDNC